MGYGRHTKRYRRGWGRASFVSREASFVVGGSQGGGDPILRRPRRAESNVWLQDLTLNQTIQGLKTFVTMVGVCLR